MDSSPPRQRQDVKDCAEEPASGLLPASCRVLDLTNEKGLLCGRLLADLGADVVQVERPYGNHARTLAPFLHETPHPEASLYWLAYAANKRGITLSLETPEGQDLLCRLLRTTNIVVESFSPGQLEALGLGYETLRRYNRGIILVSVTPFGQGGPCAHHKGPDIVTTAAGGLAYLTGDPGQPPVRISFPQTYLIAGASAALGAIIAYFHWETTGQGQWVDVSAQQAVARTLVQAPQTWDLNRVNLRRQGLYRERPGGVVFPTTWPCRDGFVNFSISGGRFGAKRMTALVEWMETEGQAQPFLREIDWESLDFADLTQELLGRVLEPISRFFAARSKRDLWHGALERQITLFPVASPQDIVEDKKLVSAAFSQVVPQPLLDTVVVHPGPFVRCQQASFRIRRPAPTVGQHNAEIYGGELGLLGRSQAALKAWGAI